MLDQRLHLDPLIKICSAHNLILIEDACEQCAWEFAYSDECDLQYSDELNIAIRVEDCDNLPSITQIAVYSFFMSCIAISGCWTALLARRVVTEKHVEAVFVDHVPTIDVPTIEHVHVADIEQHVQVVLQEEGSVESMVDE